MQEAYLVAGNSAKKNAKLGKKSYDKKMFGATLSVGDRVLVRNLSERGGDWNAKIPLGKRSSCSSKKERRKYSGIYSQS